MRSSICDILIFLSRRKKQKLTYRPQLEQPTTMLLRNSISTTKKLFKKTLKGFKSFFSGEHYQRLPQSPSYTNPYSYNTHGGFDHMNIQTSYKELDRFYTDFTNQFESDKQKAQQRSSNKKNTTMPPVKQEREILNGNLRKFVKAGLTKNSSNDEKIKRQEYWCSNTSTTTREERSFSLAEKLKELEMMDMGNVDHLLDIEEVLHYYSRLTCPAYLNIVDKFFTEMYAEFLAPSSSTASSQVVNSRPKLRSVR